MYIVLILIFEVFCLVLFVNSGIVMIEVVFVLWSWCEILFIVYNGFSVVMIFFIKRVL